MIRSATPLAIFLVSLCVAWLGLFQLVRAAEWHKAALRLVAVGEERAPQQGLADRAEAWLRRQRVGRWLEQRLAAGGIRLSVLGFVAAVVAVALGVRVGAAVLLPSPLPSALAVATLPAAAWYLGYRRRRRQAAFTEQVAEIAQLLANFSSAGLSLPTAVSAAPNELAEPAAAEFRLVADALAVGHSVDAALEQLRRRMPSRELDVLVSTLVMLQRAGGDIAHALRGIALTLSLRKEARDEIKTALASSRANGYAVVALGVVAVLLIQAIAPNALELMLGSTIGQIVLAVSAGLFAIGFLLMRRVTRIDV